MHKISYNFNQPMSTTSKSHACILTGSLIGLVLMMLHFEPIWGIRLYAGAFLLASLLFVWFAVTINRALPSNRTLFIMIVAALAIRASFLFAMPVGSDDIFRYLWDGKVQSAGINPYIFPPDAAQLSQLRSDLLPGLVNHPEMKTVYFPVSQFLFRLSYALSGESVWGFKLLLLAAEIFTLMALVRITDTLSLSRSTILLYAFCPLPIIQFAYDAHLDGMGLPIFLFGLYFLLKERRVPGYLLLGLSMAVKPVALVVIPVFVMREKGVARKLLALVLAVAPFALQFIPYWSTPGLLDGLFTFSRHWSFNGLAFELANAILSNNLTSRLVCAGALVATLCGVYFITRPPLPRMYLAVMALLLFSPVVHPWYICWFVVLLPLVRQWSGVIFAATASLTVFTVVAFRLTGVWSQSLIVLAAEYLPVLIALAIELRRPRGGTAAPVVPVTPLP
jgi:alpha-1,6-mannosyltransferase